MTGFSNEEIQAARALVEAATPGPWEAMQPWAEREPEISDTWWVWRTDAKPYYGGVLEVCTDDEGGSPVKLVPGGIGTAEITDGRNYAQEKADAEFIAAARTLVPRLLDALEEARAERDSFSEALVASERDLQDGEGDFKDLRGEYEAHLERCAGRLDRAKRAEAAVVEARKAALLEAADEVRRIRNGESSEPGPYAGYIETWLRARAAAQESTPPSGDTS